MGINVEVGGFHLSPKETARDARMIVYGIAAKHPLVARILGRWEGLKGYSDEELQESYASYREQHVKFAAYLKDSKHPGRRGNRLPV